MYSYKYTLEVSSWSQDTQKYITDLIERYDIAYNIEKSILNSSQIILTIKGNKHELDKLELRLIKNLSSHTQIEDFSKTTTFLDENILINNNFFDIKESDLFLISNSKKIDENPIEECIKLLKAQKIGIIKNLNGYYLCAISNKSSTIKKIRQLLSLSQQDLPLLVKNIFQASKFVKLSKKEEENINSPIKPLIKTKKKNLHRLEKSKNIPLNAVSLTNTYYVKLPKNFLETLLTNDINIPLIFIRVDRYLEYIDNVDFILTFEKDFLEYDDTVLQIVYGKQQIIKNGYGISSIKISLDHDIKQTISCHHDKSTALAAKKDLILSPSGLKKELFYKLYDLKPQKSINKIKKEAIAKIHTYDSRFMDCIVFEFSKEIANIWISKQLNLQLLYTFDQEPNKYFKSCLKQVKNQKDLKELDVEELCNNLYEICYEKSFDYSIKDKIISINLEKDLNKNEVPSTLINTFTDIVKDIYQEYQLPVVLCGSLFENKNLTENIIEFFDDHDVKYHISSTIPLNSTCAPLGCLLDIIDKK